MHMYKTLLIGSVALGAACLLVSTAAATQGAPSPHDELAKWTGHWKVRIDTKETQFDHAATEYFDSKCAFFPHGTFMYCDYLSLQPDAHDDIALLYYSDVDKVFKYTNVAQEGGPSENVFHVDGAVWTRPFEVQSKRYGVIDAREIYTFISPDKQSGRLEVSTDKGAHWIVVNEAMGVKQP